MVNPERVRILSTCLAASNQPCRYQGKTSYLYIRIIKSLIAGRPLLYQSNERVVYHVSENGVEVIESRWLPSEPYVAFVDADEGLSEPHYFLRNPSVQIILTSSPRGANQNWSKQGNYVKFTKLATKLWSHKELFLTGLVSIPFLLSMLD